MINLALIALAYVIGMIPNAYLLQVFINKEDLGYVRSDAVGAYDVFVNLNKPAFFLTLMLDLIKGALLVHLAFWFGTWPFLPMLLLLIAMIARNFNLFIGIRNGLGVAILMGGLVFYAPWTVLVYVILVILINAFINELDSALALAIVVIPLASALFLVALHSILFGIIMVSVVFVHKISYTHASKFRTDYHDYKSGNPFA